MIRDKIFTYSSLTKLCTGERDLFILLLCFKYFMTKSVTGCVVRHCTRESFPFVCSIHDVCGLEGRIVVLVSHHIFPSWVRLGLTERRISSVSILESLRFGCPKTPLLLPFQPEYVSFSRSLDTFLDQIINWLMFRHIRIPSWDFVLFLVNNHSTLYWWRIPRVSRLSVSSKIVRLSSFKWFVNPLINLYKFLSNHDPYLIGVLFLTISRQDCFEFLSGTFLFWLDVNWITRRFCLQL